MRLFEKFVCCEQEYPRSYCPLDIFISYLFKMQMYCICPFICTVTSSPVTVKDEPGILCSQNTIFNFRWHRYINMISQFCQQIFHMIFYSHSFCFFLRQLKQIASYVEKLTFCNIFTSSISKQSLLIISLIFNFKFSLELMTFPLVTIVKILCFCSALRIFLIISLFCWL